MVGGLLLVAGSISALATLDATVGMRLLPTLVVMGVGIGLASAPTTAVALAAAPDEESGSAAALVSASRTVGLAFGVAFMGALVGGAATPAAFAATLQTGFAATAAVAAVGALVAFVALGVRRPRGLGESTAAPVVVGST
jgi:hypothetical protein